MNFGRRRAVYDEIGDGELVDAHELEAFERIDGIYRSLCAILYNYAPTSGHPGGSISSGRIAIPLVFGALDLDLGDPSRRDADILSYAAGHKALGLYALWALRNEVARIAAPDLLPSDPRQQLRLEELLGFRRNPTHAGHLFRALGLRGLDGHPTPATPFVKLATGASGVGVASSLGLAIAAADLYGADAPRVHVIDGEGGLTPGRVAEALAIAGTARLSNVILHVDWNNASIDSERVCRNGTGPGEYVQWDPRELAYLHDWNVVYVPDGTSFAQVLAAQRRALAQDNGQPTAIVYRTVKGWQYGITGRASHGAGHKLCAHGFYAAAPGVALPCCDAGTQRCRGGADVNVLEECFWDALQTVRAILEHDDELVAFLASRLCDSKARLDARARTPRADAPRIEALYEDCPAPSIAPGSTTTLRGELGRALDALNRASGGALLVGAADLLGSTSASLVADGFPRGFWNARDGREPRTLAMGGICEDAMSAVLSGISTFGAHVGVGSSYGAFLAPLGHIAARLHAIGRPAHPMILVCAHAGLKTGEDGPTHADPQCLQLFAENFPFGAMITLTPWEPQEIWPLLEAALAKRPAVIAPFVTRPSERVPDRAALGLAPAADAAQGVYRLRRGAGVPVVLQESGVAYAFVEDALPRLIEAGVDVDVWYVASPELFAMRSRAEQERIFPSEIAARAIGITGFTLPTMYRWITSPHGRAATLHPFRNGHYLGSGSGASVLAEAGLDGESQARAVIAYVKARDAV